MSDNEARDSKEEKKTDEKKTDETKKDEKKKDDAPAKPPTPREVKYRIKRPLEETTSEGIPIKYTYTLRFISNPSGNMKELFMDFILEKEEIVDVYVCPSHSGNSWVVNLLLADKGWVGIKTKHSAAIECRRGGPYKISDEKCTVQFDIPKWKIVTAEKVAALSKWAFKQYE